MFAGYYGHEHLIRRVVCEFNCETCYKTGDLAWFNTRNKQLEFRSYRNHLVKLKSQSMELREVESVFMDMVTSCIVIITKHKNIDYLVVYVQTTRTIQDLKQHCLARLPFYIIPSIFIIVDTFTIEQNGKINQRNLPSPDFTSLSFFSNEDK